MLNSTLLARGAISAARPASAVAVSGPSPFPLVTRGAKVKLGDFPVPLRPKPTGIELLHNPLWNKGTAFPLSERDSLGLRGLLPPCVKDIDFQIKRVLRHLDEQPDSVTKNLYLQDLHSRNETLYHRLLVDHIEDIAPLIYTPTVGNVCQKFGANYRRARGMYFSRMDRGLFSSMVYNWPHEDVRVIVVTDGSRILGLGDLGVHGMGIPVGKLALYCGAGGIAPHRVMPVTLDVGTNNEDLLADPNYQGIRERRLVGDEYYEFVDEFVQAVVRRWPDVIIQFEDFESSKAAPLLDRYRNNFRVFNDDIQGTGSVTLSALLSAARNIGSPLSDMKFLCVGAGSAGLGVCSSIVEGMVEAGMSRAEAMSRFIILTKDGALGKFDGSNGNPHVRTADASHQKWFNHKVSDGESLLNCVKKTKPTVLLGLSTAKGVFSKEVITEMNKYCERPIIMPMSNPTSQCECTPQEALEWTNGAAVVATGSPFDPVTLSNGKTVIPSQCNNMYIFPGIGLAASVSGVTRITDKMLYLASLACTNTMTEEEIAEGRTFPVLSRIREVSANVATSVIIEAMSLGIAPKIKTSLSRPEILSLVESHMYYPDYVPLIPRRGD